jgi:hypothetical protein
MSSPRLPQREFDMPPARPIPAAGASRFLLLEREVEHEYRPRMLTALQSKVDAEATAAQTSAPFCPHCGQPMPLQDRRSVSWLARCGRLHSSVSWYRCRRCRYECRPLLDWLGVEPGRISGALARWLALLASIAPYPLAARLAWLLLGVTISPKGIWRATQRLGEAAVRHSEALDRYHADPRSTAALAPYRGRLFPRSEDGRFVAAQRASGNLSRKALGGAPVSGELSGRRRRHLRSSVCPTARIGLVGRPHVGGLGRGRSRLDLESCHPFRASL